MLEHQGNRLLLAEPFPVSLRQLAEGRARAVEQRLPADRARPALQRAAVDARALVVMKGVGDAVLIEPRARLLHGVAILDAVDRDRLRHCQSANSHSVVPAVDTSVWHQIIDSLVTTAGWPLHSPRPYMNARRGRGAFAFREIDYGRHPSRHRDRRQ